MAVVASVIGCAHRPARWPSSRRGSRRPTVGRCASTVRSSTSSGPCRTCCTRMIFVAALSIGPTAGVLALILFNIGVHGQAAVGDRRRGGHRSHGGGARRPRGARADRSAARSSPRCCPATWPSRCTSSSSTSAPRRSSASWVRAASATCSQHADEGLQLRATWASSSSSCSCWCCIIELVSIDAPADGWCEWPPSRRPRSASADPAIAPASRPGLVARRLRCSCGRLLSVGLELDRLVRLPARLVDIFGRMFLPPDWDTWRVWPWRR